MDYQGFQQSGTKDSLKFADVAKKYTIEQYKEALKSTQDKLSKLYSTYLLGIDKKDYYNEAIKYNRLKNLQADISSELSAMYSKVNNYTVLTSSQSMSHSYYTQQFITSWLSPYTVSYIDKNALEYAVTGLDKYWDELSKRLKTILPPTPGTLSEILAKNKLNSLNKVKSTITQGLINGQSYTTMSKSLKTTFNSSANNALRVIRTETHRVINQGQYLQWKDAEVKGVEGSRMILSVLDDVSRPQSAKVDTLKDNSYGLFNYPGRTGDNGVTTPGASGVAAWDINDRETVINIIDDILPTIRRGKNPLTGENEVFSFISYPEWAKKHNISI